MFRKIIIFTLFLISSNIGMAISGTVQLPETGQTTCSNENGIAIPCSNTGQDGDIRAGVEWPNPRFTIMYCDASGPCADQVSDCDGNNKTDVVKDNLTGLIWTRDTNPIPYNAKLLWQPALDFIDYFTLCGFSDWHLPNINELETMHYDADQEYADWLLAQGFINFPDNRNFWSSTTDRSRGSAFISNSYSVSSTSKTSHPHSVWPVRSGQSISSPAQVWKTGQTTCYNEKGDGIPCSNTGQDGDIRAGVEVPNPRFKDNRNGTVADNLTGLQWLRDTNCIKTNYPDFDRDNYVHDGLVTWQHALDFVKGINNGVYPLCGAGHHDWRLPNRLELRSLIDYTRYNPALPVDQPFQNVPAQYLSWSSTSVMITPSWFGQAWVAYSYGGSFIGIDRAGLSNLVNVWPVRSGQAGVLDHFEFSNILSPQSVGVPFQISITAKDAFGNTVTDFNNSLTLSATSGNINPTTIDLLSGIGTGNITLDTISSDSKVMANGTGKLGQSDLFNVAGSPNVTTDSATNVMVGSATLNGTVNANNGTTAVTFQYGLTNSYGSTVTADQSPAVGDTTTAFSKDLTGLSPNKTYHYRATGVNFVGTTFANEQTFTTLQAVDPPSVTTNPGSGVASTGANLNGVVNPNGTPTNYFFQLGKTTSYGQVTSTTSAGNGTSGLNVSASINSLIPNTFYHYRLVANNSFGTTNGKDQTFKTLAGPTFGNFIYLPLLLR
jgi:hypothetical protein